jgi:peptidyl-prolyl cis-trans isomerase D
MMQTLRNNMKYILLVVLLSFLLTIVVSWGMGGFRDRSSGAEQGIIGVVNGQKIMYEQFASALDQEMTTAREQAGTDELSEYQIGMLRDRVWQTIERDVLLAQEVKRLNIQASSQEIVFFMRNSPPDFIRNNEQFQTDGQFDMAKYQEALRNPAYYDAWIPIENYYRGLLPIQKLQQWVISTARVSDEEVLDALKKENERVNVRYLFFNPASVSSENVQIADAEIEKFYKDHQQDYEDPEQRKFRYVAFDLVPTREDSLQIVADMQYILDEINGGADFAEMAKEHSQDGTAQNGGDLGFFGRGGIHPFEDAAFDAKVGSIVGPVKTPFGVHLIKVIARKEEKGETEVQAAHILLKYQMSPDTREKKWDTAQYFYETVEKSKGKEFEQIASQEGYKIEETPFFRAGDFIPQLGMASHANYLTFKEKPGWVSKPVKAGERIVVFQISDIQKASIKPLDAAKDAIRAQLEREGRMGEAKTLCQTAWNRIQAGGTLEQIAGDASLEIQETGFFSMTSTVPFVGKDPAFIGAAFALESGDVSKPVAGNRGYYLLELIERSAYAPPNESTLADKKTKLIEEKKNSLYMAWYADLKSRAEIKDLRREYF